MTDNEQLYDFENSEDEDESTVVVSPKAPEATFNPPEVISQPKLLPKTPIMTFDAEAVPSETPKVIEREKKPETPLHVSQADDDDDLYVKLPTPIGGHSSERRIGTIDRRNPTSPISSTAVSQEVRERAWALISDPLFSDFKKESTQIQDVCMEFLRNKYIALNTAYKDRNVVFPENQSVGKVHRAYHETLRSMHVSMNLGSYRLGYIVCVLILEVVCVKLLGLPMAGFTKMEWERIKKYDQLMLEIGETMYSYGTSQWPLHYRMAFTFALNMAIFVGLKFATKALGIGSDKGFNVVRAMIDRVLENNVSLDDVASGTAEDISKKNESSFLSTENISGILGKISESMDSKKEDKKPKKKEKRMIWDD